MAPPRDSEFFKRLSSQRGSVEMHGSWSILRHEPRRRAATGSATPGCRGDSPAGARAALSGRFSGLLAGGRGRWRRCGVSRSAAVQRTRPSGELPHRRARRNSGVPARAQASLLRDAQHSVARPRVAVGGGDGPPHLRSWRRRGDPAGSRVVAGASAGVSRTLLVRLDPDDRALPAADRGAGRARSPPDHSRARTPARRDRGVRSNRGGFWCRGGVFCPRRLVLRLQRPVPDVALCRRPQCQPRGVYSELPLYLRPRRSRGSPSCDARSLPARADTGGGGDGSCIAQDRRPAERARVRFYGVSRLPRGFDRGDGRERICRRGAAERASRSVFAVVHARAGFR